MADPKRKMGGFFRSLTKSKRKGKGEAATPPVRKHSHTTSLLKFKKHGKASQSSSDLSSFSRSKSSGSSLGGIVEIDRFQSMPQLRLLSLLAYICLYVFGVCLSRRAFCECFLAPVFIV